MEQLMLKVDNVSKMYKLGQIGGTTLREELQRRAAKRRGKEDPTRIIGARSYEDGETFLALDGVSFEVKKGERVGIIGHNGAGKSTLLKLISRVTAPTSGKIGLNGRVASMLEVGTGFHGELTGRENIYMNGAILGMTKKEIDSKIEDIIEFSEVRQFIDTPVKRYSSGMYVKLAFSVAAHLDAEIMIMDEVLAVGDMAFQKKCLEKMSDVSRSEGRTILYVSHNMNTIRQLCDRVIVLDHGKVVFDGDVEEGIETYLGKNTGDYPAFYDLSCVSRPSDQHGKDLIITAFSFHTDGQAFFNRTEPIVFDICFECKKTFERLGLYFVLQAENGERIGLAQTLNAVGTCQRGKSYTYTFSFDASNLTGDNYYFIPDLFTYDGYGKHYSVDHPMQRIMFKLVENMPIGLDWQKRYYGYVRLNTVTILSGGEQS